METLTGPNGPLDGVEEVTVDSLVEQYDATIDDPGPHPIQTAQTELAAALTELERLSGDDDAKFAVEQAIIAALGTMDDAEGVASTIERDVESIEEEVEFQDDPITYEQSTITVRSTPTDD
ncbi:hypothetical protein [Halosegnis longus]|uniref:hypothetical protein n=1 Tax=Halosegnis longus TaxID=2216012 RepID=UPI00129D5B80|nr:hypothetical protein [Halosegnis longus]